MTAVPTQAPDIRVLSLGAGVQSTVLALMAADGALPDLDCAIFADTGWEPRRVYDHLDRLAGVLDKARIPLHRVTAGNLRDDITNPDARFAAIPYYVLNHAERQEPIKSSGVECPACGGTGWLGGGLRDGLRAGDWNEQHGADDAQVAAMEDAADARGCAGCDTSAAAHSCYGACPTCRRPGGTAGVLYRDWYSVRERVEGMGPRQCTKEYKLAPIRRKLRELLGAEAPDFRRVPKGRLAEQWIGFSTDEIHRVGNDAGDDQGDADGGSSGGRGRGVSYLRSRYPLLDLGMSRDDCHAWLGERGWGTVAKSACIGCPFHGNAQWRDLRDNHPAEWADAVDFDRAIRKGGARGIPLNGTAYLHRSRVPLDQAPIDRRTARDWAAAQSDVFGVLAERLEDGDPEGCSPYGCRSGERV